MNDFERESSTMDMKEEMMSDAVDDAMEDEDEGEGEEAEGDKILKEVLDEIGMGMNDAVSPRESRPEAEMSDPRTARGDALKRVNLELMIAHIRTYI
jgi:division protein CdvB (Snf7/Vps24/ESCRT-III family)